MRTLLFIVLSICVCAPAHAVLVEFNLDSNVQIRSNNPNGNFDSNMLLNVDNFNMSNEIRSLIQNDSIIGASAGQVPTGVTIDSAVLSLYQENPSTEQHNVHQVNTAWQATVVTWASFNNGGVAGTDYVAAPGGSFTPNLGTAGYLDVDVKDIVQAWADGDANRGFLVVATGGDGSSFRRADETGMPMTGVPRLTVNYSTAAIPEPSSFALFGLVACGYGLKRWKKRKAQS